MEILIVEDDEGLGELVSRIVEHCGGEPVLKTTAAAALEWLALNAPPLMLLDWQLPDLTGKELLEKLQAQNKPLPPFIVTSGHSEEREISEMKKMGARDVVVKDSGFLKTLPRLIQQWIQ